MLVLLAGLVIFLGVHCVSIVAPAWRVAQVARRGELAWKAVYSLVSALGLVLIVVGYGLARREPVVLYVPPAGMRHLALLLMLPVFPLLFAAYLPGRIRRAAKHPMLLAVKLWALAHLLANGTLADVLLFGGFLAWAILSFTAARKRDRAAGKVYPAGTMQGTIVSVVVGLAIYAAFVMGLHTWLIGVRPV